MNPHHFIFPNCETENALDMHPFHGMSDCIPHHTDDHMMLMQPSSSSAHHHHHSNHNHHNHHSSHYLSTPSHQHHHHHHHTESNVMMDDEDSFIHHSHHHNSHHPHSSQQQQSSHHISHHLPSLSNTMGMMIPHDDMNDIHQPSSYSVMQEYGEHLMSPPPMHNNNNRRNQSSEEEEEEEDSHHTLAEQATTADHEEDDAEVDEEDDNNALDEDDNKKNKKKKKKKKDCVDEHDIDTFSCGQCNRVYQYLSSLKSHCKSVHKSDAGWKGQYSNVISKKFAKNRDFACPMCDSSCASHYGLRRHMTTKHRESQKKLLLFYLIEDLCLKENSKHRDLILSNDKDYVMELKRRHLDELEQELECISPGSALTTPLTANSNTLSSMYPPPPPQSSSSSFSTPNQASDDDDEEEDDVRTPVTPFASLSVSTPTSTTTTTTNTPTTPMTTNGQPKQKHTRGQGKWTETEKRNFLEGVKIYGKNNLHMIARFIKTKDAKQVEKFSNKYFSKLREGFQSLLGSYYSCVLTNNNNTSNVVAAAAPMTMVASTSAVTATTSSPHHTTTSVHTGSINHHLPTIGGGGGSLGNLTIIPPSRSSAAPAILLSNPPSGHTPSSSRPSPSTNIFLQSTTVPSASSSSTAAVNTNAFYHSSMPTHHMQQPTSPYHHQHQHQQHHTHAFSSLTAPSLNSSNSSNSSDEERVSDSSVEQSPLTKRKRALSSTSDSTFPSNGGNSGLSASGNRLERKKMKSESPVHHSCITDMLMEGPDHLGSESSTNAYLLDSTSANIYSHHMSFGAMPTSTGVDSSGDVTDAAHVHSTNVSSTSPSSLHDHSTSNHNNSHDALGSLAQSIHSDGHHSDDHSLLSHQQHLNANASLPMDEMLQSRLQALHQQKQQANQEEEYDIKPEEVELFNNMLFDDSLHNGYSYCQFIENETH